MEPPVYDHRDYGHICHGVECYSQHKPIIINMYAQILPGKNHGNEDRVMYFKSCLEHVDKFCQDRHISSINVSYKIGCGLAGCDWNVYLDLLKSFEDRYSIEIIIHNYE